ncbi:MAG: DUF5388 domain-containing protein [Lactobacillus sp.]|nr:DUF5388 domain-containing protein [Lactobacillus sp.]
MAKLNPLVNSNRNRKSENFKPQVSAHASDFDNTEKEMTNTVTSVTFDTNLKISNHSRNKLQAMASIGYSENQRTAVDVALQAWYDTLTMNEQKEFDLQVHTLERRDVRIKRKH